MKLKAAIYSIKHSSKKPFLQETREEFSESLDVYVGGAMSFAQESLKLLFEHHGEQGLADGGAKKGTIIFTGTLGALRCNPEFAAYGGGRAAVRMVAQSLGRELSAKGVHVVHVIASKSLAFHSPPLVV
jgi:NAD(P)-dependent dehydrogenase (short-subunit alcohol dehydrogenase family)